MRKIKELTWKEIFVRVDILEEQINFFSDYNSIKNIYGVPRGGLIAAVLLSHKLNLPLITDPKKITKKTMIVDDICDSGKSLKKLTRNGKFESATLILSEGAQFEPTLAAATIEKDVWIIYPWESKESSGYYLNEKKSRLQKEVGIKISSKSQAVTTASTRKISRKK